VPGIKVVTAWMMWEVVGPRERAPPQLFLLMRWAEEVGIMRRRGRISVNIWKHGKKGKSEVTSDS
jgi:hypothetical protein